MKPTRRSMLTLIAGVPVIGPLASKLALDQQTVGLMNPNNPAALTPGLTSDAPSGMGNQGEEQFKWAMQIPWFKEQHESLLYEENRHVYAIDPDLAAYRSFSINAKICFQRQRNVQKQLEYKMGEGAWHRLNKLWMKLPFNLFAKQ